MSQPTGLFSVRRPRETLGPIQNYSGIPQPASTIKRTSSSQDMRAPYTGQHVRSTSINNLQRPAQPNFHRSSSGTNLVDMGQSTVRRSTMNPFVGSASVSAHRASLAPNQMLGSHTPASTSVQRRSSIYSRPSAAGPLGSHTFFSQQAPAKRQDPRVPMSRALKEQMAQELYDYLSQNNFELEMKHSLRPTAVTAPTGNDFNLMFQWLYKRIDPHHKFQRALEVELPLVLKQLLPYQPDHAATLATVSVDLSLDDATRANARKLHSRAYDGACTEAGVDVQGDRIVSRFLFSAYQDWLQVSPDQDDEAADAALEPHRQLMQEAFDNINAQYADDLAALEEENHKLKAQMEEIAQGAPDVAKLEKHFKILEDDKKKFEDYNANVEAKIEKYQSRLKILEAEIEKTEIDLQSIEQERQSLQQAVDRQGLNVQDIDRMNSERDRLTKAHDDAVALLEETNKTVLEKEIETAKRLEDLEAIIKRYNTLGYQTSLIPSSATNAKGQNFELVLQLTEQSPAFSSSMSKRSRRSPSDEQSDRLLAGPFVGYQPQSLLPPHLVNLRDTARTTFLTLRKSVTERRRKATENALSDRDLVDSVSEMLHEKNAEIDNLNYKLTTTKDLYAQLKDEHNTSYTQMLSKREKTEKELAKMRDGLEKGVLELEQREMEVQLAWEGMKSEAERVREEMHFKIEKTLEDVVRFKLHIKEGLEVFEGWVAEEVEAELMEEGAAFEDQTEAYE